MLKVSRCGICGSDLHMTEDPIFCIPQGTVLGHEFSGEVVDLGPGVERLRIGDRVSVIPIASCGTCARCLDGQYAQCGKMLLHGGGYAEYTCVHERQCILLPVSLSEDDGALVEPLAVGLHGVLMSGLRPGDRVMVVGAGPIGLAVMYWCRRFGASQVVATASSLQRRDLAHEIGADLFVDPARCPTVHDVVAEIGGPADIVFECVGKPGLIDRCIELVRPRGTVVVLGLCTVPDQIHPFTAISKEVRIQMAVFYDLSNFENAAHSLDAGYVEPRAMITDRIGLSDLPDHFEALRNRSSQCKVIVSPDA